MAVPPIPQKFNSSQRIIDPRNGYPDNAFLRFINSLRDFAAYVATLSAEIVSATTTSGTYVPSITDQSNILAATADLCSYSQTGEVVTVSGHVNITPVDPLLPIGFKISQPVASSDTAANFVWQIESETSGVYRIVFIFTYRVIP